MEKNKILITCPKGLSPYLKNELIQLGFPIISESVAGVETEGVFNDTLKLNLLLRTGHRVLFFLRKFKASFAEELYMKVSEIEWEEYISEDGYISVTSYVDTPTIKDSRFANLKCKDAIVDRIKRKCGKRPDSGNKMKGVVIFLYWKEKNCSIYLDTSGEPLSKRDYRKIPFKAPLQETLASALVIETGWKGDGNFINPMCGSGTLAIEAAFIALNRPSGILRRNFSFMHLKNFDNNFWNELKKIEKSKGYKSISGKIIATDIDADAIKAAKKNAQTAGVDKIIEFSVCDFKETKIPEGEGVIILNPEYGERLGKIEKLKDTYKEIGDFFKQKCKGYKGYIFTGNLELAKHIGLKTKKRTKFFNSTIECRLLEYELYEGSKKVKLLTQ